MKAHILYVEDDESLGYVTRDNLELKGFEISHYANGNDALRAIEKDTFDLCILDVMLPGVDGFALAEAVRAKSADIPILFLSAKSLKEDKIKGLKLGADDYITKPFSIEELILKIEVFLRRSKVSETTMLSLFTIGTYNFDYDNLTLAKDDNSRRLTQKEANLLRYLVLNKNQVLKRGDILEELWGENDYFLGRSLDVFISRLRKYLKEDTQLKIENLHGVGFRFICNS